MGTSLSRQSIALVLTKKQPNNTQKHKIANLNINKLALVKKKHKNTNKLSLNQHGLTVYKYCVVCHLGNG